MGKYHINMTLLEFPTKASGKWRAGPKFLLNLKHALEKNPGWMKS